MKKPTQEAQSSILQERYGTPAPVQTASAHRDPSHKPGGHFSNLYDGMRQAGSGNAAHYPANSMHGQEDRGAASSFHGYPHGNPESSQGPSVLGSMFHIVDHGRHLYPDYTYPYRQTQFHLPNQFS